MRHIEKRYNILNNDISRNDMLLAEISGNCRKGKDYVMADGDVVEFRTGLTSGGKK